MVSSLERELLTLDGRLPRGALAPPVRSAMVRVPRHEFVAPGDEALAYRDSALPIGHRQTISQPLIVALMTELLELTPGDVVLEAGTGSGYQAAVLAEVASRVLTIEVIPELAATAEQRLARLGYDNVEVRRGDAAEGWPERAPFDGVLVTAATERVPPPLLDQLAAGRRLIIPLGSPARTQQLTVVEKRPDGGVATRAVLAVRFVPLTHPAAPGGAKPEPGAIGVR